MKETGVIVGVKDHFTVEDAARITAALKERFPGVTFALVSGASSVAFEWSRPSPAAPEIHFDPGWFYGDDDDANKYQRRTWRRRDRVRPETGKREA